VSKPLDRLRTIVGNVVPSKVVFHAEPQTGNRLYLTPTVVEEFKLLPSSDPLQAALSDQLRESWSNERSEYVVFTSEEELFKLVKQKLVAEYERVSARCHATKRKTEMFIYGITLDNSLLANFLLQLFVEMKTEEFAKRSLQEQRIKFETLESLRRVYGSK
jgi:hypothetical protein